MALTYADTLTFVQNLTPTWRKTQQEMLTQVVQALVTRPSLCPAEIARVLPNGPHSQPEQSLHGRLKRLNRFLDNPRLDEAALFSHWYHLALRWSSDLPEAPTILPILLNTTYFEPFAALIASVPCGGRALPIAFTTYHRHTLEACFPPAETWPTHAQAVCPTPRRKGQPMPRAGAQVGYWASQNAIEEPLLAYLRSFLTPELPIVVVADRGFARASLLRWFLDRPYQFVIRFDGDTWLHLPNGTSGAVKDLLALRPGDCQWIPQAAYGKDERLPVAVLAIWDVGQKEPWYLATNLANAQTTETAYRWRMCIEAGNHDEKTGVVLREGGDHHELTAPLHLHRLLLANLTLHWLCALTGLQAYHDLPASAQIAPELETVAPDAPDLALLDHGPAQPPPVRPHRGAQPNLPRWLRRFAVRGHLSYVRLGLEILRDNRYTRLVRRAVRWLGIYLWIWTPL
jgi:hypothetical protein